MKKLRFLRPGYFIWLAVPLALFALGVSGDLYVLWSYDWRALGADSRENWSQRHYTRCTYVGRSGTLTDYPADGKCGLVRFASSAEAAP